MLCYALCFDEHVMHALSMKKAKSYFKISNVLYSICKYLV